MKPLREMGGRQFSSAIPDAPMHGKEENSSGKEKKTGA